jgi:acetyltransferase-like isoleucine patch superfamily enzyme
MWYKNIFFILGRLFSFMYPYKLYIIIEKVRERIFSGWISQQFYKFDSQSIIRPPINLLKGGEYIHIGEKTFIGKYGVITAWDSYLNDRFNPQINIGNNVSIGEYCHITAINKIVIGNGVLTGRWVTITDNAHGKTNEKTLLPPGKRALHTLGPVIIDDNVWIGDKVTILPNVHIGKNVVIGSNSVVTKDIPQNSVAVGIPAKVVKFIG